MFICIHTVFRDILDSLMTVRASVCSESEARNPSTIIELSKQSVKHDCTIGRCSASLSSTGEVLVDITELENGGREFSLPIVGPDTRGFVKYFALTCY